MSGVARPKPNGLAQFTRRGPVGGPAAPATASAEAVDGGAGAPAVGPPPGAAGRGTPKPKLVGVYVMPDGHRQLKVEAAKRGATVSDLVREALNAWFANEQLPPLA